MKTKKNGKTLRVAGLLLALVLVTSCFVGGTFAKYVTSGTGGDSARAAMFGVTVTVTGSGGVFAKSYASDTNGYTDNTVVAKAGVNYNVVAPGTKSSKPLAVTLAGTPEVAVKVTYTADDFYLTGNWLYNDGQTGSQDVFYCPLIFKITGKINGAETTETINCLEKSSADDVKTAVKTALAKFDTSYLAGTDLSTAGGDGLKISWEWPFEGGESSQQTDAKDTYLGNLATATDAESHNTIPAVHAFVTATVTQID